MAKVFLLGDSTCAHKEDAARPETGWGEMFSPYIKDGWQLENLAKNGRSTRMILLEGIYFDCYFEAEEGDWVIIQFGHNENKPESHRFSTPEAFADNLRFMISNLKKKAVNVVLASPISRRRFENGRAVNTHIGYPEAMEAVAREMGLPFLELTEKTLAILNETGDEESKKWFMNFPPGLYENYPEGKCDDTHLRPEGAKLVASLVAEALEPYKLPFMKAMAGALH